MGGTLGCRQETGKGKTKWSAGVKIMWGCGAADMILSQRQGSGCWRCGCTGKASSGYGAVAGDSGGHNGEGTQGPNRVDLPGQCGVGQGGMVGQGIQTRGCRGGRAQGVSLTLQGVMVGSKQGSPSGYTAELSPGGQRGFSRGDVEKEERACTTVGEQQRDDFPPFMVVAEMRRGRH